MTLSSTGTTLQRGPTWRSTHPRDGANQDIQYFITRRSGSQARIARAVRAYEKGLAVSSKASASTGTASSSGVTYCVFPGKRISGYCRLKLKALTSCNFPSPASRLALNWEMPPLRG